MDEDLCNELLDDMDFHYNKVKCRKIEVMLPKLMKMVEGGDGRDGIATYEDKEDRPYRKRQGK